MKMHEQLVASALRIPQSRPRIERERSNPERIKAQLEKNLSARYVHVSRDLMLGSDRKLDVVHREVKDKNGVVHKVYPKGVTYNVGSNRMKRENHRAHVLARVEARSARA